MVICYTLLFDGKLKSRAHLKSNKVTPAEQEAELARALITIMSEARDVQSTARTSRVRARDAVSCRLPHQVLRRAISPGEPLLRRWL